ncbi:class I SAM-dependent methyltransferase [Prosthecomicrobium sp. N25]|uniref:class I SAM-dependent methyltransferase n=1 Tax=Prosthecomicrobium sp. N25 TaxID=3129254 RepID=UPI00307769B7
MPGSSKAGKAWIEARCALAAPVTRILDVGVGRGTYSQLLRERFRTATWVGVEVWEPYVAEFGLAALYDRVIVADARSVDYGAIGPFDLCFLGDVLEHMSTADARALADRLLDCCRLLFISVPIGHFPQGAVGGNPFETHVVEDYSEAGLRAVVPEIVTGTVETRRRWTIGAFAATRDPALRAALLALEPVPSGAS